MQADTQPRRANEMDWLTGGATSLEDIISALAERGCSDLTNSINPTTCSEHPIAGGGFCDVYQGDLNSGIKVAIKVLRIYDKPGQADAKQKILKRAAREIYHWSRLKHRNILPLMGLAVFRGQMSMISEWMGYGDLKSYVEGHPEVNRISLCIDVCAGLCYIHEKGIAHGDLKAANVMVSPSGLAMVADFGNSRLKDLVIKFTNTTHRGRSIRWTAPELLQEESSSDVTREADVYAFGMTMLETLTGKEPYEGISEQRLIVMVTSKYKHPARPKAIASDGLWNLLARCWSEEPSKRPIIMEVSRELQKLSTPAGGINAGDNPMPRRARRQQSHPLPVSTPEQKMYGGRRRADQVVKGKECSAEEASGSNSGGRATGREQGGANTDSWKESLIDDTVRERARPPVSRRSTLPNESRAAAYQEIFARCPRPQPGYRAREDNAHSPDAQFSQYQPHPDVFGPLYSRPHPPVEQGDGKGTQPSSPSMDGSQGPQAASQKPGSEADGGYPHRIIPARSLLGEATDPATERLKRHGLAPAQALRTPYQRAPMSSENVQAALAGAGDNASPLGRRNHVGWRDRADTCSVENAPARPQMHFRSVSADIVRPPIPTDEMTLSPVASHSGTTITGGRIVLSSKLKGGLSKESLVDYGPREPGQLWIHSVPQEIVDGVSDQEKKRQEAINEVIYTERDFVRDLEYIRDRWMGPLRTEDIIPPERRIDFVQQVFRNIEDILAVSNRLRDLLTKRQNAKPIVETIGDIFSELVPHFQPFVQYGRHQIYGKYEFEKEKSANPAFGSFVEMVERLPESRRLELNGYLTKPTARLAWYPQLLEAVLEHTPKDNPDRVAIPKVVKILREFLGKVNEESGKTEDRFNLLQLDKGLVYRPGEEVDLKLKDEHRQLVYKGPLKRRGGAANEDGDLQIFLFDHALLMVKRKTVNKQEQLKVFRRPIPLDLLVVSTPEENSVCPDSQHSGYQFTISHLGKKGYSLTLWAPTVVARRKWVEHITAQQEAVRERSMVFDTPMLSEDVFVGAAKVNCSVPYDYGRRIAYGTDVGVYFQSLYEGQDRTPVRGIEIPDVQQIDVLEEFELLVVLSERSVLTFPLDALDFADPLKRMKRISSHTSFFKAGYCLGRTLVCVVKAGSLTSTIKTLEPIDQSVRGKNKPTFKKLLQGGNDTLKVFKEFYIPTESHSIHFLKTKLCVACTKGFEIVDLETLDTQVLLDPADASLNFVQKREDVRPVSIYRIDGDFLLCYTEFAFYVNKSGWRSKRNLTIYWEGSPTAFALHYPYVMAFDPTFVEIRHVDDGSLTQVIRGSNLRLLFADTQPWVVNSSSIGSRPTTPPSHRNPDMNHEHKHYKRVHVRDEIVVASGDKVMAVQLAAHPQHL